MSKKIMLLFAVFMAFIALTLNPSPSYASGGATSPLNPYILPGSDTTVDTTAGLYNDVDEMADRIVDTEGEILVMSDRIVETEEIVATVSPNDAFDNAALDASGETRSAMDEAVVDNMLPAVEVEDGESPATGLPVVDEAAATYDESAATTLALSDDIGEMADRILYTEGEIGVMADRIVETEEILAAMARGEDVEAPADDEDNDDDAAVESSDDTSTDGPQDTVLSLSNDIGEMADRILYTEGEIGTMADRIVDTEYLLAETAQDLDSDPSLTASDAEVAPALVNHTLGQMDESTPSTDTVTEAIPYESMEVIENGDGASQEDTLILADDIGDMADNILSTEGDIGTTADEIVETENVLSDSLLTIWH